MNKTKKKDITPVNKEIKPINKVIKTLKPKTK